MNAKVVKAKNKVFHGSINREKKLKVILVTLFNYIDLEEAIAAATGYIDIASHHLSKKTTSTASLSCAGT